MKYNITTQYGDAVLQYWTQKAFSVSQTLSACSSSSQSEAGGEWERRCGRGTNAEVYAPLPSNWEFSVLLEKQCLSETLYPITVVLCQETWIPAENQKGDLEEVN